MVHLDAGMRQLVCVMICDAWPVYHQTYGYLSSHRALTALALGSKVTVGLAESNGSILLIYEKVKGLAVEPTIS